MWFSWIINYITVTCLDVSANNYSWSVHVISVKFSWDAVLYILKYLKGIPCHGILFEDNQHNRVGYSNANWAECHVHLLSTFLLFCIKIKYCQSH